MNILYEKLLLLEMKVIYPCFNSYSTHEIYHPSKNNIKFKYDLTID